MERFMLESSAQRITALSFVEGGGLAVLTGSLTGFRRDVETKLVVL